MPGRRKTPVNVRNLVQAHVGRPSAGDPFRVFAIFDQLTGPAGTEGREAIVVLPFPVLADLLGSVPASVVEDPEDMRHLVRAMELLRRNGKAASLT